MVVKRKVETPKKKKSVLDDVRDELRAEAASNVEADEEYDAEHDPANLGSLFAGMESKRKHPDEIAIDEMLMGLEGNDWYLKLSKETAPNVWQFKRRIDQFRHWADMELEINLLVQKETAAEIKRRGKVISWGSGRYMITFFSDNGVRGNKRKPVFFDIDAQEPDALPPTSSQNEMLDVLRETITSPKDVIQQNVESMQKGMELAAMAAGGKSGSDNNLFALMMNQSNNQTQMMVGLITAMMGAMGKKDGDSNPLDLVRGMAGTMKDMGMLLAPTGGTSLTDQVTLMKTLGLIKNPEDSDPFTALTKMKGVLGILQELTGAGPAERPGIMDKLIDAVGPHIGKLIGAVENISSIKAKEAARAPLEAQNARPIIVQAPNVQPRYIQAPPQPARPGYPSPMAITQGKGLNDLGFPTENWADPGEAFPSGPVNMPDLPAESYAQAEADRIGQAIADGTYQPQEEVMPVQAETRQAPQPIGPPPAAPSQNEMLSQELFQAVITKDYSKFTRVTQMLNSFFGNGVIRQQILSNQLDAKGLVNYVTIFDRVNYTTKPNYLALQDYAHKYIESIRQQVPPGEVAIMVYAKCNTCQAVHEFDNMQQWNDEANESGGVITCGINSCQGTLAIGE